MPVRIAGGDVGHLAGNVSVAGGRNVDGAGDVRYRIFLWKAHIEHRRRAGSKNLLKPFGGDLGAGLPGLEQTGLEDVWGCGTLRLKGQHAAHESDQDGRQGEAHKFLLSPN